MWDFIYEKLEQIAVWQVFAVLVVLFVLCFFGFRWRQKTIGQQLTMFDGRWWYNPGEARELLEALGANGRRIYAFTQITLDFLFPFVYGGLFIIGFFTFYDPPGYLLAIPLIMIAADLLENITTAYLAWSFKGEKSFLARIAAPFTLIKWLGAYLSLFILLFGISVFVLLFGLSVLVYQGYARFIKGRQAV